MSYGLPSYATSILWILLKESFIIYRYAYAYFLMKRKINYNAKHFYPDKRLGIDGVSYIV